MKVYVVLSKNSTIICHFNATITMSTFNFLSLTITPGVTSFAKGPYYYYFSVPGPPSNIKAISLDQNSVLVSWMEPVNPNGQVRKEVLCSVMTFPKIMNILKIFTICLLF